MAVSLSLSALLGGAATGLLGLCRPFNDVTADMFSPFVLEIFYLGTFSTGASTNPKCAASDGVNFWITLNSASALARL